MSDYLTTKELAELLRIKERKVYDLAASEEVPCSKAMGKLLFSRREIEAWLAENSTGPKPSGRLQRQEVVLGSHDPLLEWALRESRCGLATNFDSSLDGLERFAGNQGIAAGLHVFAPESRTWNVDAVSGRFRHDRVVLVEWARRQRGLICRPETAATLTGLEDLKGRRVAPRQPEAGSQVLLEHLLAEVGLAAGDVAWTAAARSEADVTLAVLDGKADATFGLATAAAQYRLAFVPVVEERYDLLVDRHAWFEPAFQRFLAFCRSDAFIEHAAELAGYHMAGQFRVHMNGAV